MVYEALSTYYLRRIHSLSQRATKMCSAGNANLMRVCLSEVKRLGVLLLRNRKHFYPRRKLANKGVLHWVNVRG